MQKINHPVLMDLLKSFGLSLDSRFAKNHSVLNQLSTDAQSIHFVSQDDLPEDEYYESYIYRTKAVPTRSDNWHDFLNGLIWHQFPRTKQLLNSLHVQYIAEHGLHPRGAMRDRITHFDECGIVIYWQGVDPTPMVKAHDWEGLFCHHRHHWFSDWQPVLFGHAMLEMLLDPYVGMTAKAVCIESQKAPLSLTSSAFDNALYEHIQATDIFNVKRSLLPLPVLGIPGWHFAEQDADFYNNKGYFMPARTMNC